MTTETYDKKPKFDPNKKFTAVEETKPAFDPSKPFEDIKKKGGLAGSASASVGTGKDGLVPLSVDTDKFEREKLRYEAANNPQMQLTEEEISTDPVKAYQKVLSTKVSDRILKQPQAASTYVKPSIEERATPKKEEGITFSDAKKEIERINKQIFATKEQADQYLVENQDKGDDNLTKQLALKRSDELGKLEEVVNTSASLDEAAVRLAAMNGDEQMKALLEPTGGRLMGVNDETSNVPMAVRGAKLLQLLSNPDFIRMTESNPQLKTAYKEELFNFPNHYPEYATNLLATEIAKRRDQKGLNNKFANIVSKETTDKIMKELIEDGTLPANYQFLYEKTIRPKLGTWRSVGRGFGNAVPGLNQIINEAPIPTSGLLESVSEGLEKTEVGIAKSIVNLPSLAGLPTVQDAMQPKEQQLFNVLKDQYETPTFEPSRLGDKLTYHGGNLIAFVSGLSGGTSALKATNLITNPKIASATMMGLATLGDTRDKAISLFPRNDFKQMLYIDTMTGLNSLLGKYLPGQQIPKLLAGGEKTIADVLKKMVDGDITTSAAKNQILEWFGNTAKSSLHGAEFMGAISAADDVLTQTLEGKDFNFDQTLEAGWEGFKVGLMATPILSGFEAALKSNKGFRSQVIDFAQNADYYKELAKKQSETDTEFAKISDDVIKNIDYVGKVYNEIQNSKLSDKEKQTYVLNSLSEKIKTDKANSATDPTIKKRYQQEAKDISEIKDAALSGIPEEKVKTNQAIRDVKELYDNDFLSKGAMEMLEKREGEEGKPKFDEGKVKSFLKFLAQQSNNITEDGKFNEGSDARSAVEKQYPSQLIDLANEMFPEYKKIAEDFETAASPEPIEKPKTEGTAENVVPSTSEVEKFAQRIMKGEQMTTPEDLQFYENNKKSIEDYLQSQIKPKEDAVPIEKSDEMDVRQQTADGEGVGKGDIQSEIPTGKEKEGKGTGEETGVGKPPLPPPPKKGGAEMPEGDARRELDKLANNVPDSGRVAEYMSKETIEKYTGETPTNDQRRGVQELEIALEHGEKIIEKAQIVFGKDYVDKTLDYIEQSTAPVSNKALMYVSLENALGREKVLNPEKAADITKQQALVYEQSQKFARENSLALNYQKLRRIAKVGYDIEKITDNFFSPEEREAKSKIEKAVEADADAINKEAENQEVGGMTPEIEKMVQEGVEKEIAKIYEKLPKDKKSIADKAIAALENVQKKLRGKAYDAVGGIPVAIVDAGISTIKMAIKAGVKVADAIELGINKIKEKWGKEWPKENEFRKDLQEAFKDVKATTDIVKEALIKKGFGREITVKGEKKTILDWKKLAGKAGTVSKISENVAEVLKDSGLSAKEIEAMKDDLVKEYVDLRTSVIEKAQTELARRNKENVTSEQKSAARRLAELYTFGLFESKENEFDITLNKALGAKVSPEGYNEAKEIAKAMESIYTSTFKGVKLSDISGKAAIEKLEDRLRVLLFREARKQGNNNLRIATMVRNFMEIQQTMILNNMKQFFENPFSGLQQNVISKIEGELSKEGIGTGEMADQRRKMMKTVYRDMVLKGGVGYGKTEATFVNRQHLDDFINKLSDNQLYHAIASIATGKTTLNAMDAMWKVGLTEKKFAGNLIKILTHETNKNRMSKEEAQKFVSEKLTGQTLEEAQQIATKLIEKINKEAGKELIPTHKDQINRLANDIVKASLEMGGKITSEQVDAAFNAAYRSAGLNLGHTANNFLSAMIHGQSAKIEGAINQAIRNKEWDRAALLTYYSVFYRNVLNPFVGGGTNWLVLKFEKTGLGLITGLAYRKGTETQLDLTTERGQKLMEDRLYNQSRIKDQYMRGLIGGLVTWTSYAAFLGLANTDDYRKWRGRNPWAARYLDIVTPESMLAHMAVENKSVKRYASQSLNKNDAFDASTKLIKAADYAVKGKKNEAWGALGEALGSKVNLPLPWRLVKDNQVIYQGIKGQDPYHGNYKPSTGFMNGVLQGGAIEWLGFRPEGKGETPSPASSKSQKPTKETKQSKSD